MASRRFQMKTARDSYRKVWKFLFVAMLLLLTGSICDHHDEDGDGVDDNMDNCKFIQNPDQEDSDGDGIGDACEPDTDDDGVIDDDDNCPATPNPDQKDDDGDLIGDACDGFPDKDKDGIDDRDDNCPEISNPDQKDTDGDDIGDACEDSDNDGVFDVKDNCPSVHNPDQTNSDGDGFGNACDNCPSANNPDQADSDGDGDGNVCDNCPSVSNPDQANSDGDGFGNACDNCPSVNNPDQADFDSDGVGDACERAKIVYTSYADGDPEIFIMKLDGSGQQQLTNNTTDDLDPAWSPDGTKIAFSGPASLHTIRDDGSDLFTISTNAISREPSWSPDGQELVFEKWIFLGGAPAFEIWRIHTNGTGLRQLTSFLFDGHCYDPDWSPDGSRIVYVNGGAPAIFIMNANDGNGKTRLTNGSTPSFSRDGKKIFFSRLMGNDNEIFSMNADGTNETQLTFSPNDTDFSPAPSPLGNMMVFQSRLGSNQNNTELLILRIGETNPKRLTNNGFRDEHPDWR